MQRYEYRVVPAPRKGIKTRTAKTAEDRFAAALEEVMNAQGAEGWDYVRSDTLPAEERQGLTGRATVYQNMLVFRRAIGAAAQPVAAPFVAAPPVAALDAAALPVAPAPLAAPAPVAAPAPLAAPLAAPAVSTVPTPIPAPVAPTGSGGRDPFSVPVPPLVLHDHAPRPAPAVGPAVPRDIG